MTRKWVTLHEFAEQFQSIHGGSHAKPLAKEIGEIRRVIYDQDACAARRLPEAQAHAHDAASAIAVWRTRGNRTVNSVKSPTSLSTVIVPPCCWVTMS